MLAWARQSARLDVAAVAAAEKISAEKLEAWERGEGSPSLSRLRKLANRYKRPLMVFYLAEPPKGFSIVKDFRFLPADVAREFSPELTLAIRVAQERQAWAASYLEDSGADPIKLVGSVTAKANPADVGQRLREQLGISLQQQSAAATDSASYGQWRRAIERVGVFVFQTGKADVTEMRGFALPNKFAPAIVVNSRDFYRPRTFTLIHELAHILIGEAAVSGSGEHAFASNPNRQAERFCNQIAAETLVPAGDFVSHLPRDWAQNDDGIVAELARRYWVSRDVIRLRLVDLQFAGQNYFDEKRTPFKPPKKKKAGPIRQEKLAIARAGESFSRVAISAYRQGEIHGGELSTLLGMTLKHLNALEIAIFPNRLRNNAG
jgi:Zn-dependent peptidase ImmA (M78 family)/transcriptional regulator with XRE-family HTH domain